MGWWGVMRGAVGATVCLCVASCALESPAPSLDAVKPSTVWTGEATVVQVEGHGFVPRVLHDLDQALPEVDNGFEVWVEGPQPGSEVYRFSAVSRKGDTRLEARAPEGLEVGAYRLWVALPTGQVSENWADFEVAETRADHLQVDADDLIHEVGSQGTFRVSLLGPDDARVFQDVGVTLEALDEQGERVGTFSHSLEEEEASMGWLSGRLGPYGESLVGLTVQTPGLVTIIATPDPGEGSALSGDTLKMSWVPGSDTRVRFELPSADFRAVAGEAFPVGLFLEDTLGNPIEEERDLTFTNGCGSWVDTLTISGEGSLEVMLTTSTGGGRCSLPLDTLVASGEAEGESGGFEVLAGPASTFDLLTTPNPARAGTPMQVLVTATDGWSNRADWLGEPSLQDSLSGFTDVLCDTPIASSAVCSGTSTLAGEGVVLTASVGEVVGESAPYRVLAEPAVDRLEVVVSGGQATAGTPVPVSVLAFDRWGNQIQADDPELDFTGWVFEAGEGSAECSIFPAEEPGAVGFGCTLFLATPAETLIVNTGEVEATSAPFEVENGPLSELAGEVSLTEITAGQSLLLTVEGRDAWGNPYVAQADASIEVRDSSGTWSVPEVVLGAAGSAVVEGTLTRVGEHTIDLSQGGETLGSVGAVTVVAGPADSLHVAILEPWSWVEVATPVRIELMDAYGNRVIEDSMGEGRVQSTGTDSDEIIFTLVNGLGSVEYTWEEPSLGDTLEAEYGDVIGLSQERQVGKDCGEDGPDVVARFAGAPDAVACWDPVTETALEGVSFLWTSAGETPIHGYGVAVGEGEPVTSSTAMFDVDLGAIGIQSVRVWAIDTAACASEDLAWGYVGEEDGEVVGLVPIALTPESPPVRSEEPLVVHVGPAKDCFRDLAMDATVYLRASRGELEGVLSTGRGLAVVLDGLGEAEAELHLEDVRDGGELRVSTWVESGAAAGAAVVSVVGDERPPSVWDQDPQGETSGWVDRVRFTFSEPMLEESITAGALEVEGPSVASVASIELSDDGLSVDFVFDFPLDASLGVYHLRLDDQVRDLSGNLLDGDWTGAGGGSHFGAFGATAVVVDDLTCEILEGTSSRFHPDGDDGEGDEADRVVVTLESITTPAWWWASVRDLDTGQRIRKEWVLPSAAADLWSWGGRDAGGEVISPGDYQLEFQALDALGNTSELCSVVVELAQHGGGDE